MSDSITISFMVSKTLIEEGQKSKRVREGIQAELAYLAWDALSVLEAA